MRCVLIAAGLRVIVAGSIAAIALVAIERPAAAGEIDVSIGSAGTLLPTRSSVAVLDFNNLSIGSLPSYQFSGGTLTGMGAIEDTSLMEIAAEPAGDTSNYLTVAGLSPVGGVQLTFDNPENYFGLYWGSLDTYNSISFYNGQQTVASYSGGDIANLTGLIANGDQHSSSSNRYVNFNFGSASYDIVVLSTTSFGFELDNIAFPDPPSPTLNAASAVPEPA